MSPDEIEKLRAALDVMLDHSEQCRTELGALTYLSTLDTLRSLISRAEELHYA